MSKTKYKLPIFVYLIQDADEGLPDFANMTEEEQIAFAMQMSMQDHGDYYSIHINIFLFYIFIHNSLSS